MGVDCYCNFRSEPGSIPVPQAENSDNNHKKIRNINNNPNNQNMKNKISFNNINEHNQIKNENINNIINKNNNENNNSGKLMKCITDSEFEKIINEHSTEISKEKFLLLIKGKIKEIETELGEINESKKKEYLSQKNQNIINKSPLYFSSTKNTYFGTWSKNTLKKEGWGIIIDENGNKYEGGFKSDKLDGYCRIISVNGDYYEGEIKKGIVEGNGIFFSAEKGMLYNGEFKNNLFEGTGEQVYDNYENHKITYVGQFKHGKREGKGKLSFDDGNYYEGNFTKDKFDGEGYFKFNDGREYKGNWKENEMNGEGVFIWNENQKYEGQYKDSRREGHGTYYFGENNYFQGNWLNNLPHGEGKLCNNGKVVEGLFRFGKLLKKKNLNEKKLSFNKIQIENGNEFMRKKSKK